MSETLVENGTSLADLTVLADRLRRDSILSTTAAGSGHPTSCLSCAELVAVLFFRQMRYYVDDPQHMANDRFVLSKGHAAPILWAVMREAGVITREELETLRQFRSLLEGHPTPRCDWVKVATGSLGQGLSAGAGMALADRLDGRENHTFVLCGDGDLAEGQIWEAAQLAWNLRLNKLTAVVDVNALGQTGPTMIGHDLTIYQNRFESFGWVCRQVDGHDIESIIRALDELQQIPDAPTVLLAKTDKGHGVEDVEGAKGQHGKPLPSPEEALKQFSDGDVSRDRIQIVAPTERCGAAYRVPEAPDTSDFKLPEIEIGATESLRSHYGKALSAMGNVLPQLVALDGEVKNSTPQKIFPPKFPSVSSTATLPSKTWLRWPPAWHRSANSLLFPALRLS